MSTDVFISIEVLLITAIIFYQFKIGVHLFGRIKTYGAYVPIKYYFKTEKVDVDKNLVETGDIDEVLARMKMSLDPTLESYDSEVLKHGSDHSVPITLINPKSISGTYFDDILESLNIYLLKNNGGIADFSIVKDLVERNVAVEEEDIKDSINKPLYLGLMATILGIIFGLFTMLLKVKSPIISNDDLGTNQLELDDFLTSVCIAMLASLIGLSITTLTGLKFFKDAKRKVEQRKNGFYNFVHTELLPVVSQDFGSSISKLSQSMHDFNIDFKTNVSSLSGLFMKNYDTLKVQDDILDKLQRLNAQDFAKTNANVLSRLEKATGEFDKFNFFVETLNSGLSETSALSSSLSSLMNRVNNFEGIASKLDLRVEESNRIISFIESQFSDLEKMRSKYTTMIQRVDDNLDDTLNKFSSHIILKREGLVTLINEQHDLLEKAYVENKTKFDKLDLLEKLDKLDLLFEMNNHIKEEKEKIGSSSDKFCEVATEVSKALSSFVTKADLLFDKENKGANNLNHTIPTHQFTPISNISNERVFVPKQPADLTTASSPAGNDTTVDDFPQQNSEESTVKRGFTNRLKRIFKR
ncbi:hypothetical protein [Sphingobacterium hungaricum]|uniref:Uncharacterized protein n=1 Tax=Sphingobacterium hungaricum TaxID=2082723 RepID=A0A928UT21_9SPHI|nr:hypothetical protein [Sphingobacterium hungaricum]MBE8712690.1 hypothetical protein [Sphingobacterium hungaricum]